MNDLYLGLIAFGVLVMAVIQVAAIVFAARAARRVGDAVSRFEQDVKPLVANLQALTAEARPVVVHLQTVAAEAARATTIAAAQVERTEQLITNLSTRVDETVSALQDTILRPAREVMAIIRGLVAAFGAFGGGAPRSSEPRRRPASVEEEDALFIG